MKLLRFLLPLSLFIFSGCSTKTITPSSQLADDPKPLIEADTLTPHTKSEDNTNIEAQEFEEEFTENEPETTLDPLSGYNRVMTTFNDKLFTHVVEPISEGYATITPLPVRESISNFVHNIQFPIRFANNLLQGKFQNSSDELERFIINSTVGIGGLFDPATTFKNIPAHNEDFGQTLGHYGVGPGFHIVLPFLGPSNIRDVLGLTVDAYSSPLVYQKNLKKYKIPNNNAESIAIYTAKMINKNSLQLGAYESLKKDAIELYPFLRDVYEQKRISDIEE